ncbi:MAG: hypothetical protein COU31_01290 [Candidatus Magasanikbacteria bacterium CG10_big_fil_rev_8_21_14_0_10_40_10]|uniref:Uncharacterized protein n=1 Tax=Candidatus Magasanikbacteria bacterium CG10_big_fil_rev_8_21_14_0_10_40_10 TaxID=1974648 RepID=A0A2M6W4K8_9BACT|nr:MAG: hypothetical protein COU31_01290 [Candidatus Magasanikbacteria bacterium CG10_big_fil_rev_8_21_14_0_10_40_10]
MSINDNLKKIKISLRYSGLGYFAFWRILNLIIIGLLLAGGFLSIYFIYQNINTALVNSATILNLKSNLTYDALNIIDFEKARQAIDNKKKQTPVQKNLRNLFVYGTIVQTATSTNQISTSTTYASSSSATSTQTNQ